MRPRKEPDLNESAYRASVIPPHFHLILPEHAVHHGCLDSDGDSLHHRSSLQSQTHHIFCHLYELGCDQKLDGSGIVYDISKKTRKFAKCSVKLSINVTRKCMVASVKHTRTHALARTSLVYGIVVAVID